MREARVDLRLAHRQRPPRRAHGAEPVPSALGRAELVESQPDEFEKDGRTNRLTEEGDKLLSYARRLIFLNRETLAAFDDRAREPNLSFAAALKDLKRRGKL